MNNHVLYNTSDFIFNRVFPSSIQLFSGTQKNHAGTASIEKIESIRRRLFEQKTPGISFNETKVSQTITDGTCSAMALEFAISYLQCKNDLSKKISKTNLSPTLASRLLLIEIKKLGKSFQTSNEEMRTRQAAYDTIEVLSTFEDIDTGKGKIQSIANYHNFTIDLTTDEINSQMIFDPEDIREYVSLPKGVYLLRTIKPAQNEKLEQYGHSTIYIQEDSVKVFYDPNRGAYDLSKEDLANKFFAIFQTQLLQYQNNKARFYRLSA